MKKTLSVKLKCQTTQDTMLSQTSHCKNKLPQLTLGVTQLVVKVHTTAYPETTLTRR